jgi:hypothetical protein
LTGAADQIGPELFQAEAAPCPKLKWPLWSA